jgi:hypothetical protein
LLKEVPERKERFRGQERKMKELANSVVQLVAIIMILITLAVSTAAVSQWAGSADEAARQEVTPVSLTATAR